MEIQLLLIKRRISIKCSTKSVRQMVSAFVCFYCRFSAGQKRVSWWRFSRFHDSVRLFSTSFLEAFTHSLILLYFLRFLVLLNYFAILSRPSLLGIRTHYLLLWPLRKLDLLDPSFGSKLLSCKISSKLADAVDFVVSFREESALT